MNDFSSGVPSELTSLIEALPEPRIAVGLDYRILAANRAYREAYVDGEEVEGRHCYEVSHRYEVPCHEAGESCPRQQALQSGHAEKALHVHHTPRGEEHVLVELSPIRDRQGRTKFFLEQMRTLPTARDERSAQELVGRAPAFLQMLGFVARVAPSETTALLLGETGTGKEMVARAIHAMSPRSDGPFVPVECTGLSEALFETEMFGHEKGAFTGADHRKTGLVEAAAGGTLFLDEIGDVSLPQQVKLLRLIETGRYRRVGGVEPIASDVRLLVATHRDLDAMVLEGSFRADLFYRINAFPIRLPPLRERREDIAVLAESLLERMAANKTLVLAPDALQALQLCDFPGNVRELRNALERASLLADAGVIHAEHLPCAFPAATESGAPSTRGDTLMRPVGRAPVNAELQEVLRAHRGSRKELAEKLGLSERTLYRRLKSLRRD